MRLPLLALSVLSLFLCGAGEAAERYRVEVIWFPKENFTNGESGIAAPTSPRGRAIDLLLADPNVEKFTFQKVELAEGTSVAVNDQKNFSYADSYDAQGKPHLTSTPVGPIVKITLKQATAVDFVDLDLDAKNVSFTRFETPPDALPKQPIFSSHNIKTHAALRKGYWQLLASKDDGAVVLRVSSVVP